MESLSGISRCRKFTPEEEVLIQQGIKSNDQRISMLQKIRNHREAQNDNRPVISQDIYNYIAIYKKLKVGDLTPMEYLVKSMDERNLHYVLQTVESKVTNLFYAFQDSVKIAREFPWILLVDSTYKTNKHNMPLFQMVGMDSSRKTFCIAFAFLTAETKENFKWALQQLKNLFINGDYRASVVVTDRDLALVGAVEEILPETKHNLCLWHINKQVTANCKHHYNTNDEFNEFQSAWNNYVRSATQADEEKYWEEIVKDERFKQSVEYLTATWLPYKMKFVK